MSSNLPRRRARRRRRGPRRFVQAGNQRMTTSIINMPYILPDRVMVHLPYRQSITMTNVSGTGTYVFSLNSIYDPDVTGGGHQVLGYEQWATLYQQYEVISSSIHVTVLPPDSLAAPARYTLYPATVSTTQNDSTAAAEQPYAKTTLVTNATLTQYTKVHHHMSVQKLEGRQTASINFTAPFGASPTLERYWHMVLFSLSQSTIGGIYIDVEIVYHTVLFNRFTLNESPLLARNNTADDATSVPSVRRRRRLIANDAVPSVSETRSTQPTPWYAIRSGVESSPNRI